MAIDSEENTDLPSANVRAASYYIARTHIRCPHCGVNTQLTGVALAPDHETFDDEAEAWQSVAANAFLFNIQAVSCPYFAPEPGCAEPMLRVLLLAESLRALQAGAR